MNITYDDKVDLVTSALPRQNKAVADDFNEIKEVVNKNAGTLLWTNSSPSEGVSADTLISLDLSSYSSVKIVFKANATDNNSRYIQREIELGLRSSVEHITPYTNQASIVIRQRTFIAEATGVTLEGGTTHTIGGTNSYVVPDVNALIPYKIYGIG